MSLRTPALAILCTPLVAGCGGSSPSTPRAKAGPYGPPNSPYALSKCMRANGLTHFPDPVQGSGGVGFPGGLTLSIEGYLTVDGVTFSGPPLRRASKACSSYLPGDGARPPALTSAHRRAALEFARCMRAHGVPDFPDPAGAGPGYGHPPKRLPDANSPAFRHAGLVCGRAGGPHLQGGNLQGP